MTNWTQFLTGLLIAFALGCAPARAEDVTAGALRIEQPFSRATPGGAQVGAGYMTITNTGTAPDRLVSVSTAAAEKVEIHEMAMQDGVMKMRQLTSGLEIAPGKAVALAPGGFHLMMMGLKAPLKQGDRVPVTLTFEKAGNVAVTLDVRSIGGQKPAPGGSMNHMHKM